MARRDKYLDHLASIPIFSSCSTRELMRLGQATEEVTVPAGDVLVKEGRTGREFFLIIDGQAVVRRNKRKVAELGPGDHFGELSLFEKVPRNASVEATTDLDVLVLHRPQFHGLLTDVPSISLSLLRGMARRLREADARAVH